MPRFLGLCTLIIICVVSSFVASSATYADASFQVLGFLGGATNSTARAVSADGQTVVGDSDGQAFRWTPAAGITALSSGTNGSTLATAHGISADGHTVVGSGDGVQVWNVVDGLSVIPSLDDLVPQQAYAASNDGSAIVGRADKGGTSRPFLWQSGNRLIDLGSLDPNRLRGEAAGLSDNGLVAVGKSTSSNDLLTREAFRWTEAEGMLGLGHLGGREGDGISAPWGYSFATGVSGNGSVVVGTSLGDQGPEAFAWTEAAGMVGLGGREEFVSVSLRNLITGIPDFWEGFDVSSAARAASYDGAVIVGDSQEQAAVWTVTGYHHLGDRLIEAGLSHAMLDFDPTIAYDVSADGQTVVGEGISRSTGQQIAFLATLPEWLLVPLSGDFSGDGRVDQADLNMVLSNWGDPRTPADWNNTAGLGVGIDQDELNAVLSQWGETTRAGGAGLAGFSAVPEPTLAGALFGAGGMVLRRKRVS